MRPKIAILGIFVADLAFRAPRLPVMGETILGQGFALGPGGKGSNQAVAAARAGGDVSFITRIGRDAFGDIGLKMYAADGVNAEHVEVSGAHPTGAAFIFVSSETGDNAIIVNAGAAGTIDEAVIDAAGRTIAAAKVFVTQLETPVAVGHRGLQIARQAGRITVFNPAPAAVIDPAIYALSDYVTPNESEAELITGLPVKSLDDARRAGDALLKLGAGAALITLGDKGALLHAKGVSEHIPSRKVEVVDTTGAGDAFNGAFAVAIGEGRSAMDAARFACAAASISVTRPGTAPSMATREEIEAAMSL